MLHEDDDDDASRVQSSVASSTATVQELTGILSPAENENKEIEKPEETSLRTSLPKKKFPSNGPRNLRRGGPAKSKLGATSKTLNGKIRKRSPLRHSTGSITPINEDEVSTEGAGHEKAERRKSTDSASIGLPGRVDRSWQGWAEVSETSSGWSDVYQDDDDSLEDFDEVPFMDDTEGIIEKPIILEKPEMKRNQSAPQGKEEDDNAKPKLRTKSSARKLYNALDDDEIDKMNSSGFSVTAIITGRRSHSVPPKVEVPETTTPVEKTEPKEQPEKQEEKESERKSRVEKKMQDAIQTAFHDSSSSLFSVSAFLKRSHSVPPKVEAPDAEPTSKKSSDESNNKQASRAKQSTKKLNKSGKLQDSNSSTLSQSLKKLPKGSGNKEDAKADELSTSLRDKVRGRSSNRKVTSSTKLQGSQSSGLSSSSKVSMPKNKERRSHSVPSQVEQPKVESLLNETPQPQPKPSQTSLNKLRGRSSNRKVATSSKSSKMEESQSSGMSNSSKKSLPRPDKVRRSHSVPTEVEQPPPESLLKETPPKTKRMSPDKLRGRSSNRKLATSSSKPSKLDESQSSAMSNTSRKSQSKGKIRRSQSVPSEVEDKVALAAEAETPKMANKTAGAGSKDKVRGQSSSRKMGGSARMQDSSSTGISVNSKKSISKSSRRGQSVPAQKDHSNSEEQEAEKPRPSSKERTRDRSKAAKKLSSSGRLDDSYSTTSRKSNLSKESRRRSQSVPSQKDLPKSEEPGTEKPRPSSKERARTKKLSKSGRLEDSQSTGLSLSSHKSHKSSSSKRSQSVPAVPAPKENREHVEAEDEKAEQEEVRRGTPTKTKYPSRRRDSPVAKRTGGRAQSLSTLRSRNTALNMFNKSTGSAQPLELSIREDETRRMVKEAGFLEASEYIGNTRSKSLGRQLYRRRDSVEQEPKVYLPPNIPRDRSGRRWSLNEEVKEKPNPKDNESRRHSAHDSSAPAASRSKLTKAEVQKQRRARSHSIQRRSRDEEQAFSADDSNMLSPRSIDELDKNDSAQNLFGNITISELDKIKEDASLSLTDRWETVPHAIPFPEAEFPEPEWDNSKLHASDGRISLSSSRTSSTKASRDKKNRSESNLNTSRLGRKKSPKGDRSKDPAQRKRQSSESRSKSRPHSDRSHFDDAVTTTTLAKEESTFHRSADSMITPKNDSVSGEEGSDVDVEQRPKPRTASTRASLVALYGGTRAQGNSDHGAEKEKKTRRSGSLSPDLRRTEEDDLDTGLYDGSGEGEMAIQSETGPRLRHAGRQFPKDRMRSRESMKRDGRNRLAKERNRPLKNHEEEDWEEDNDEADLASKSDGELPKSDGELSLEKSPSRDSWGARKKASGRNPQQQQRNRRDTVSQDMLHQSVTSIPSLEPIPVEKPSQSSGVAQMQTVKEQPWQRRRRLSIGGEDQ